LRIFSRNSPIVGSDKEGRVFMKKIYSKPEIMFDSFTLTTSIAAGCGKPAALPTKDVCALHMGPKILFSNSMSVCTDKVDPNDDIYCYHAPTEDQALFNS